MSNTRRLIRNAIKTPDGTILESRHRHDYRTHKDANGETYMVDGGLSYQRGMLNKEQPEGLSLFDDEPHEVQRRVLKWGTYGINGDQPLKLIEIGDMEDGHLEAVLAMDHLEPVYKSCMIKELQIRLDLELSK